MGKKSFFSKWLYKEYSFFKLFYRVGGLSLVCSKLADKCLRTDFSKKIIQKNMLAKSFEEICEIRKMLYEIKSGQKLDYFHPQNYGQKLQQILLFGATEKKTQLADKYLVKQYAEEKIGDEYVVPTYGVWDSFDQIDFDSLPDSFMLKTNHSCHTNYFVPDKSQMDKVQMKKLFDQWMQENYGATLFCEIHYRGITPKIFAEMYLHPADGKILDYKIVCINGHFEFLAVIGERNGNVIGKVGMYDSSLVLIEKQYRNSKMFDKDFNLPSNIVQIIKLAEKLAEGFDFVRVDFYDIDGHIYLGEMTFSPDAFLGMMSLCDKTPEFLSDSAKAFMLTGPPKIGDKNEKLL